VKVFVIWHNFAEKISPLRPGLSEQGAFFGGWSGREKAFQQGESNHIIP